MELLAKVLSVQSEGAEKLEDDFDDITARKPLAAKAKRVVGSIAALSGMHARRHSRTRIEVVLMISPSKPLAASGWFYCCSYARTLTHTHTHVLPGKI